MATGLVKRTAPVFGIADGGKPVIEPGPALSSEASARREANGTHVINPPSGNPQGQGMMQPGMMQQGMMQPGMMQQGMMQPGMMQQGMMQQGMMQPGMMQPGMRQGMMQPGMMQPGMMQPGMMQPGMMQNFNNRPLEPPVPTCFAKPEEMYIGVLKNIVPSGLSGFILCERSQAEYQKDVYIHKNVMDVSRVGLGDQLAFKLHISQKTGIPQCSAPCWKLVGDTGTGQKPHFGPYTGLVQKVEEGTGFIQSQQVLQKFGKEAQIHGSVLTTCGIELHDTLAFDIHVGEGGQPQVTAPLWLVKKAAVVEAAGAGASLYQPKKPFVGPGQPGFGNGLGGMQPGPVGAPAPQQQPSLSPALLDLGSTQLKQQQLQPPANKPADSKQPSQPGGGAYM